MGITLRKDLDRKLTHAELDANFEIVKTTTEIIDKSGVEMLSSEITEFNLTPIHWTITINGVSVVEGLTDDIFGDDDGEWLPAAGKLTFDNEKLIIVFQQYENYLLCIQEATKGKDGKSWIIEWNDDAIQFGTDNDYGVFGFDISNNGNTVLLGLRYGETDNSSVDDTGLLYIIENNMVTTLEGNVEYGQFGRVAKISADGNTIIVGAPGYDEELVPYFRIYKRTGATWEVIQTINMEESDDEESLTNPIALTADASILAIGSPIAQIVTIYKIDGNGQYIKECDIEKDYATEHDYNYFGWDISLSDNGQVLAVSDLWKGDNYTGAVFIYKMLNNNSSTWEKTQFIEDITNGGDAGFGAYARLSDDASILVVVEQYYEPGYGDGVDSEIFVFRLNTDNLYEKVVNHKYTDFAFDTINISADNETIIIGTTTGDDYYPRIYTMGGKTAKLVYDNSEIGKKIDIIEPVLKKTIDGGLIFKTSDSSTAGERSISLGYSTNANGYCSQSFGSNTTSTGSYSLSGGRNSKTNSNGRYGLSFGYGTESSHQSSQAFGKYTKTGKDYQFVCGKYNIGSNNNIFEIGYGTGTATSSRKNIAEISYDGIMKLDGNSVITSDNIGEYIPETKMIFDTIGLTKNNNLTIDLLSAINENYIVTKSGSTTIATFSIYKVTDNGPEFLYEINNPNIETSSNQDYFGFSITLNNNNILILSAPYEDENASSSGAVYVYSLSETEPTLLKTLIGSFENARLGYLGIKLKDDGTFALSDKEKIYIYKITDTNVDLTDNITLTDDQQYIYDIHPTKPYILVSNGSHYKRWVCWDYEKNIQICRSPFTALNKSGRFIGDNIFITLYHDSEQKIMEFDGSNGATIKTFLNPNYNPNTSNDYFGGKIFYDASQKYLITYAPSEDVTSDSDNKGVIYVFDIEKNINVTTALNIESASRLYITSVFNDIVYYTDSSLKLKSFTFKVEETTMITSLNKFEYDVETDYQPAHKKYVDENNKPLFGTTTNRPTDILGGTMYFDSDLNKPIWFNGTVWVDATGAEA